jgi:ECF transporter S component (folate family)
MKKISALFTDSYHEFRNVRTLTTAAMFAAISVVLGYFTIVLGDYIKIGFATVANQFVYYLFGPVVGMFFGGALDILKYLIKPTGPYFPGFTISAAIGGLIYGSLLYKRPISLKRILIAELVVSIVCNMLLGTYWLTVMYGKGFLAILPMRVFKNLIMWPINSMIFYTIGKALEASGIFRLLKSDNTGKTMI